MAQGEQGGAPRGRTAIVVCAGVGDNANGQAAARTMQGLVKYGGFASATGRLEAYPSDDELPQELHAYTLTTPTGQEVDLYEFWWADLSRFPAAMRLYLVALYGLVLQLPATGIAALRGGPPLTAAPAATAGEPWCARPIACIEWLLAVPLVLVSVLEAALIGGFAAVAWANAQFKTAPEVASGIVLALYGALVLVAGFVWLRQYRLQRGRYLAVPVGGLLFVAVAAVTAWRGNADHSLLAGLGDSLLVLVAYVVRSIWFLVGLAMLALLLGLTVSRAWWRQRDQTYTVVSAVATSTAGFAILTGALLAAAGAAVRGLAPAWEQPKRVPWCLSRAVAWWPSNCRGSARQDPWHWGLDLYTLLFSPLVWVAAIAALIGAYTFVVTFWPSVRVARWRFRHAPPSSARRGVAAIDRTLGSGRLLLVLGVGLTLAALMIMLIWLPVAMWLPRADGGKNGIAPAYAALVGGFIVAALAVTRALNFTVAAMREDSPGNETTRLALDKAYDVATFLREPGRRSRKVPNPPPAARTQILHRYASLLAYLLRETSEAQRYSHVVFFAHSQGAVLTTTVLAEHVCADRRVDLITFGCPLRQLYARRFPCQFGWANALPDDPHRFVRGVRSSWTNITGSADPIGGTLFADFPAEWWDGTAGWSATIAGLPVREVPVDGGHGGYWNDRTVFELLAETALAQL